MTREHSSAAAIVADLRTEVIHADTKAAMLIAAMSLGLAAPIGMTNLDGSGLSALLARLGCILWFLALGCLLKVLTPVIVAALGPPEPGSHPSPTSTVLPGPVISRLPWTATSRSSNPVWSRRPQS